MDHEAFLSLLKSKNFVPQLKPVDFGSVTESGSFNGHVYEYYHTQGPFEAAHTFALSKTNQGRKGYLLTLSSKEEEQFVLSLISSKEKDGVWLGAQDLRTEGLWEWVDGPESGKQFWQGRGAGGGSVGGLYSHWIKNEPNNADESFQEDCAVLTLPNTNAEAGRWLDTSCYPVSNYGVLVEYGDEPLVDPLLLIPPPNASDEKNNNQNNNQNNENQNNENQNNENQNNENPDQNQVIQLIEKDPLQQQQLQQQQEPQPLSQQHPQPAFLAPPSSSLSSSYRSYSITPKHLFYLTLFLLFIFTIVFLAYSFLLTAKRKREIRVWCETKLAKLSKQQQGTSAARRRGNLPV